MMLGSRVSVGLCLVITILAFGCDDSSPSNEAESMPDAQRRMIQLDTGVVDATPMQDVELPDVAVEIDMEVIPDAAVEVDVGEVVPPVECEEDTAPLPAESVGDFGPLTRINQFVIPANADDARASGCDVVGRNVGSGLSNLMTTFMLDLDSSVREDANGRIETILMGEFAGWSAGQTGNEVSSVRLNFYNGDQDDEGRFLIDPESFEGDDPNGEPRVSLEASTTCERLETDVGNFDITVPVEGVPINLSMAQTLISAGISVTPEGVSLTDGMITGYLTTEGITQILLGVQTACGAPSPPDFCEQAGGLLVGDPEILVPLVAFVLGGFDLIMAPDGTLSEECELDCNAISVCLKIASVPATVVGIGD